MSLWGGGIAWSKAAENPAFPGNFSDRARAGLWNNGPIPLIPLHEPGCPGSHAYSTSNAMEENRKKALVAALGQIEKQFGKGSVMRLGDSNSYDVEVVSTGSLGPRCRHRR